MSYNNGLERKKFDLEQNKFRSEGFAAQMSREVIDEICKFDLAIHNSNRRYYEHTQPLILCGIDSGDMDNTKNLPLTKYESSLCIRDDASNFHSRFWWIEEIENTALSERIVTISKEELELLTLIVFDRYTQQEVAEMQGVNQSVISRKLRRIKKLLADVI